MIKIHKKLGQKLTKPKSKSKSHPKIKTKVIDGNKLTKINTNKTKIQKTKVKDLSNTISSKRQTISRRQSRPKSSISNTFKKQKEIQYNINMHDLVTQEDIILISQQTELELLPTVNFFKLKKPSREVQQEDSAILIQKTWRGYKTRLLVKHYLNLYIKVSKHNNESLTKKRDKYYEQNQASKQTIRSKYQININMNKDISPIHQYVYQTEQERSVAKIDKDQSYQISSFNLPTQSLIQQTNIPLLDPILRITQFQLKVVLQRQQYELMNLQTNLNKKKISNKLYNLKKNNIAIYFNEQKRKLQLSRSQLSLGFLKVPLSSVYPQISKLKKKLCYSEQKLFLKKIIQNDDDAISLDFEFTYQSLKDPIRQQPDINNIYSVDDIDCIHTSDIQNDSSESIEVQNVRQNVDYIEDKIQNILIEEFVMQLYLSQKIGSVFSPFFDINSIYKFKKITKQDIQQFINLMLTQFKPSTKDLLKRLNQKINPSAFELLKILRNAEDDMDDEFYELVLPETIFKNYRQWKDNQKKQDIQVNQLLTSWEINNSLSPQVEILLKLKEQEFNQKKIKMQKFQKDLQAMYFKAIFNCLNQSIIQVKCSYSTISGRSTIGPGQLQVSLLDSNSSVSNHQIVSILKKSKDCVLHNFKYTCPSLDTSSFQSVYKFQQVLMKQLCSQIDLNEHRWLSFFDQHLQIAMQVNNLIVQQLFLQATKEIYWKLLNR